MQQSRRAHVFPHLPFSLSLAILSLSQLSQAAASSHPGHEEELVCMNRNELPPLPSSVPSLRQLQPRRLDTSPSRAINDYCVF